MVNWVWWDRKDRFCVENFKKYFTFTKCSSSCSISSTDTQFISFMLFWRILMLLSVFWWYLELCRSLEMFELVFGISLGWIDSGVYLGGLWGSNPQKSHQIVLNKLKYLQNNFYDSTFYYKIQTFTLLSTFSSPKNHKVCPTAYYDEKLAIKIPQPSLSSSYLLRYLTQLLFYQKI